MKFLSYDGWLSQTIQYIWKLIVLNLCFVLGCIPVVTIGASSTALYACFLNTSYESSWFKRFWRAFADNLRQATVIWLIFLVSGVVLVLDAYFLFAVELPGGNFLQVVIVVIAGLFLSALCYVFPLQARYSNTLLGTIKNALVLGVSQFFWGLLMVLILLSPVVLFVMSLDLFFVFLPVMLLVGGALAHNLNALIMERIFRKIQPVAQTD